MVKNLHGGKGHKRSKRGVLGPQDMYKNEGQLYGIITSALGDHRMLLLCEDGIERIGTIRGSIRKSIWFSKDMYVLVALREFDDTRADVIYGYSYEQSKQMSLDKLFAVEEQDPRMVEFEIETHEEDPEVEIDFI